MDKTPKLNRDAVTFDLREAALHIEELCQEIERGEHDDSEPMVLRIDFEHILAHLCRAWHYKWMSEQEVDSLDQDRFDLLSRCIPDWSLQSVLVDVGATPDELR